MRKDEIRVGGLYEARVAGRYTTVRVDAIRQGPPLLGGGITYEGTNLKTGRKVEFRSAAKFRCEVKLDPHPSVERANPDPSLNDAWGDKLAADDIANRTPDEELDPSEREDQPEEVGVPVGKRMCGNCEGAGYVGEDTLPCGDCGGTGAVEDRVQLGGEQSPDPTNAATTNVRTAATLAAPTATPTYSPVPNRTPSGAPSAGTTDATAPAPTFGPTSLAARIAAAQSPAAPAGITLTDEQRAALDAAVEVESRRGNGQRVLVLKAGAGCLTGDTILHTNRAGKGREMCIQHIVEQFNGSRPMASKMRGGKPYEQRMKPWDTSIPTYVARADGGVIRLGRLQNAWCSGEKEVYELCTVGGRIIRATADHPFLTADGTFAKLGDLAVGDSLQVNSGRSSGKRELKIKYRYADTRFHPHQTCRSRSRQRYGVAVHRLVVEAAINNMTLDQLLFVLRTDSVRCANLEYLSMNLQVHHIDGNTAKAFRWRWRPSRGGLASSQYQHYERGGRTCRGTWKWRRTRTWSPSNCWSWCRRARGRRRRR